MNKYFKKICAFVCTFVAGIILLGVVPVMAEEDGTICTVDLVIFSGQSNMSGAGGDASLAPAVANGTGFEFRCGQDPMGLYDVVEPFGARENGYLSDPADLRYGTLVSAFMNKYYATTGVPVLGMSMARGGTDIVGYWSSEPVKAEMMSKYDTVLAWCKANHIKVRKQYVVWLQGETDAFNRVDSKTYQTLLKQLYTPLFPKGLNQVFVITPGNLSGFPGIYDDVIKAQKTLCAKDSHFTLGSEALHNLPETFLVDGVHYNQSALNMAGEEAATAAAAYTKAHR